MKIRILLTTPMALTVIWPMIGLAADSQAELAKQALNPVAALYSLPIQYNWNQKLGPSGEGYQSVTNIQPVLPFSLNDELNLISRTILPIIDQHGLVPGGQANKSVSVILLKASFFTQAPNRRRLDFGGGAGDSGANRQR
ncbi:hypothetical protein SAMN03159453_04229 [Pseudomonas sp. NFIX28]|nr:hypothetical protein SAMN03159453_04229 [Pseudomonas sp. NFIX28]